ncbi:hypothetical protein VTK73DRAFT_5531 [Phialemonium thermophilum]|uniref:Uncharacterized protein n=1 Tax=Phialemonium thermophilum TaxID=223376 RepID=A0ABR3V2Q4_9PEZI
MVHAERSQACTGRPTHVEKQYGVGTASHPRSSGVWVQASQPCLLRSRQGQPLAVHATLQDCVTEWDDSCSTSASLSLICMGLSKLRKSEWSGPITVDHCLPTQLPLNGTCIVNPIAPTLSHRHCCHVVNKSWTRYEGSALCIEYRSASRWRRRLENPSRRTNRRGRSGRRPAARSARNPRLPSP